MQLTIDDELQSFIPIEQFREQHQLPDSFSISLFEPDKIEYHSIWSAGRAKLDTITSQIYKAIPDKTDWTKVTDLPQRLAMVFEQNLIALAADTDLTKEEIELTTLDFRNVLETAAYKLVELDYLNDRDKSVVKTQFDMQSIYQSILDGAVRVEQHSYSYEHEGETWQIRLIYSLYGAVGMEVETAEETFYVQDMSLAFPAHQLLEALVLETGERIAAAFVGSG